MGKHDVREIEIPDTSEWYRKRIADLEKMLENAQLRVAMQDRYIVTLEQEKMALTDRVEKLRNIALKAMGDTDV